MIKNSVFCFSYSRVEEPDVHLLVLHLPKTRRVPGSNSKKKAEQNSSDTFLSETNLRALGVETARIVIEDDNI